jgi:hypothetical protein
MPALFAKLESKERKEALEVGEAVRVSKVEDLRLNVQHM